MEERRILGISQTRDERANEPIGVEASVIEANVCEDDRICKIWTGSNRTVCCVEIEREAHYSDFGGIGDGTRVFSCFDLADEAFDDRDGCEQRTGVTRYSE